MIIPEDYAQVNLFWTGTGLPTGGQTAFGLKVDGFGGGPDDAAGEVETAWEASGIMEELTQQVVITSIMVKFGPNLTGPSAVLSVGIGGDIDNPCVPANTTILLHKNTAAGGRAGSGRMYLPGAADDDVSNTSEFNPGRVANLTAAATTLLGDLTAADLPMVLLHGEGSPITVPTFVTSITCDGKVATQRRRLRR